MRIGVLTGGGDCPGLNAVIRAVVHRSIKAYGWSVVGFRHGWRGLLQSEVEDLDLKKVSGILPRGGTILGTSRTNPYQEPGGEARIRQELSGRGVDILAVIGGEDTLGVAKKLHETGVRLVGIPKTIDNDVNGTDYTFGFDTALSIATEAIDRLHTTAESHDRVIVVEVMGRHAGWIALESGVAGGADMILIPEYPVSVEEVCDVVRRRHERGKNFSIIVVAEGARLKDEGGTVQVQSERRDAFGHVRLGGIGATLAERIEERTGFESRYSVLGHIQRGGSPTAYDRFLGTRFGVAAVDLAKRGGFGRMVAIRGMKIVDVPIAEALGSPKTVDREFYELAKVFST
ncbi:MAG: 6-phosphofructokinase [Candidatus Eisenbacteria bacterium]|uniref:Pyrophosphate--fructose 6-phosphate 1-phosphotransferase n=1 Tax=Eiseniibacteriota bacterium TaxID=2212470 RepID=A0A538SAM1_UNCEI|nr:MAG: 6-phosphofructokinase [Candidatus Eisenbacteria bacterium]TMQ57101.1 MAG: 6-phosphofructokinase [Candidatus Eisenbacteria bacterium]